MLCQVFPAGLSSPGHIFAMAKLHAPDSDVFSGVLRLLGCRRIAPIHVGRGWRTVRAKKTEGAGKARFKACVLLLIDGSKAV